MSLTPQVRNDTGGTHPHGFLLRSRDYLARELEASEAALARKVEGRRIAVEVADSKIIEADAAVQAARAELEAADVAIAALPADEVAEARAEHAAIDGAA